MAKKTLALILLSILGFLGAVALVFVTLNITGTVHLVKNNITITSDTYSKVYDGTSSDANSWTLTDGTLYDGDSILVTFSTSKKDTGSYTNTFDAKVVNKRGKDVTSSYEITKVYGTLTITARPLTIKAESVTEDYDGKALKASSYSLVSGSLAEGDILDVSFDGEITDVGEVKSVVYASVKNDGRDITSDYKITTIDGILAKTKISLKITSATIESEYDGTELKDVSEEPYLMSGTLAEGDTLSYTPSASITDVGTKANTFDYKILNKDGEDVTSHYSVESVTGTLTVTAKTVRFVSKDHEITYNGKEQTFTDDEFEIASLVASSDIITTSFTASVTNVGTYENRFSLSITRGENDVTSNYDITTEYGTITVNPIEITVDTPSAHKTYDGKMDNWLDASKKSIDITEVTISSGSILSADTLEFTSTITSVNAGTYDNTGTVRVFSGNKNVTKNYSITIKTGKLEITKRDIKLRTSSLSEEYNVEDPVILTSSAWYWVSGEMADGECLTAKCTGSQKGIGTSENGLSYKITNSVGTVLSDSYLNYNVEIETGVLTLYKKADEQIPIYIAPKDTFIQVNSVTSLADAVAQIDLLGFDEYLLDTTDGHNYNIQAEYNIINNDDDSVLKTLDVSTPGIYGITISKVTITDNGADVTKNFIINKYKGTLKMYIAKLSIATASVSKAYDGNLIPEYTVDPDTYEITFESAHLTFGDEYTVTSENLYDTDYQCVVSTSGQTYCIVYNMASQLSTPGKVYNGINILELFTIDAPSTNVLDDYYIEVTEGTLEVKKISITVETGSATGTKSLGDEQVSNNNFKIYDTSDTVLYDSTATENTIKASVKQSVVLSDAGKSISNTLVIQIFDSENKDVTDEYYDITYKYGTLVFKN